MGIGPFTDDEDENHLEQAAVVLVVGDPPVGFACVELVDGDPFLWQLAVHPDHGRQGLGRALVDAVCDWARAGHFGVITLTTFRDVAWNGPFYESLGFVTMDTLTSGLSAIREARAFRRRRRLRASGGDAARHLIGGPRFAHRRRSSGIADPAPQYELFFATPC